MTSSRMVRIASAVTAFLAAAALAACSQSSAPHDQRPLAEPSPAFQGDVPEFTGPWATEFADAYRSTTSDVVHKILAKGAITDEDYASVSSEYVTCMKNNGFAVEITGPAGQASVEGDGDVDAATKACDGDMAVISSLRYATSRNPQHLDENAIVAACLVEKKVVPASYTAQEYETNLQTHTFPFSTETAEFLHCNSDPLGLAAGG